MKHTLFACLLLGVTLGFCIFSSVTVRAETQTVNDAILNPPPTRSKRRRKLGRRTSAFSAWCLHTKSWTKSTLPSRSFCSTQLWRTRTIFSQARRASLRRSSTSARWKCRVITICCEFTTGSRFLDKAWYTIRKGKSQGGANHDDFDKRKF